MCSRKVFEIITLTRPWASVQLLEFKGITELAATLSLPFLSLQAVPAVTPVDEESSDGEPDQEAVQR